MIGQLRVNNTKLTYQIIKYLYLFNKIKFIYYFIGFYVYVYVFLFYACFFYVN